jgi:hypothetical protein
MTEPRRFNACRSVNTLVWLVLCLTSCGWVQKSPSETVKAAYMACNEGKYSEAESYFSTDVVNMLHGPMGAAAGGIKSVCDENTRKGSITKVEILSEEIKGEGATVVATIHFKDGSRKENDKSELLRESGRWKIAH